MDRLQNKIDRKHLNKAIHNQTLDIQLHDKNGNLKNSPLAPSYSMNEDDRSEQIFGRFQDISERIQEKVLPQTLNELLQKKVKVDTNQIRIAQVDIVQEKPIQVLALQLSQKDKILERKSKVNWLQEEKEKFLSLMQRLVDENKIDLNNMYKYRIRKIGMMLQAIWIEDQDGIVVFSGKRYSIHNQSKNLGHKIKMNNLDHSLCIYLSQQISRNPTESLKKKTYWAQTAERLSRRFNGQIYKTAKQCKERQRNYLNPNLKKNKWTREEDEQLLNLIKTYGQKWSKISREINFERNEHQIKNRFHQLNNKIAIKQDGNCNNAQLDNKISNDSVIAQMDDYVKILYGLFFFIFIEQRIKQN